MQIMHKKIKTFCRFGPHFWIPKTFVSLR